MKMTIFEINVWWIVLVLAVLKVLGVFPWGWLWVFSPVWVPLGIILAAAVFVVAIGISICGVLALVFLSCLAADALKR